MANCSICSVKIGLFDNHGSDSKPKCFECSQIPEENIVESVDLIDKLRNLSNDELLRIIEKDYKDYTELAIRFTKEEINRRANIEGGSALESKTDQINELSKRIIKKKQLEAKIPDYRIISTLVGGLVGAFVGFLLRPANSLTGQVDFVTMITDGTNLTGLDSLLKSQAETSLQVFICGIIVGCIAGFLIGLIGFALAKNTKQIPSRVSNPSQQTDIADQIKKIAELKDKGILTEDEFKEKKAMLLGRM